MKGKMIENNELDTRLAGARSTARAWMLDDPQPMGGVSCLFEAMTVTTRSMHGMQTRLMSVASAMGDRPVPPVTLQQGLTMTKQGASHLDLVSLYSAHGIGYTMMVLGWMKTIGQQRAEDGHGVPMLLEPGDIICCPADESWAVEVVAMEYGSERSVIWYTAADGLHTNPIEIGSYWPIKVLEWAGEFD